MLSFGEAVRQYYGNYANADGRAQRSAYWWVLLYQLIIYGVLAIVLFMADGGDEIFKMFISSLDGNTNTSVGDDLNLGASGIVAIVLMVCFALSNFLPDIMLSIRRFHDLGQTGWLVLGFKVAGSLPVVGIFLSLINFVWFMLRGTVGSNKYGRDPLGSDLDIFG